MRKVAFYLGFVCLIVLVASLTVAAAAESAGTIAVAVNQVEVRSLEGEWQLITAPYPVEEGDRLRTGPQSRAVVVFADGSQIVLNEETTLEVTRKPSLEEDKPRGLLRLLIGAIFARGEKDKVGMDFESPNAVATIRGTTLAFRVTYIDPIDNSTASDMSFVELQMRNALSRLTVGTGTVYFENPYGGVIVAASQRSETLTGQGPSIPEIVDIDQDDDLGMGSEDGMLPGGIPPTDPSDPPSDDDDQSTDDDNGGDGDQGQPQGPVVLQQPLLPPPVSPEISQVNPASIPGDQASVVELRGSNFQQVLAVVIVEETVSDPGNVPEVTVTSTSDSAITLEIQAWGSPGRYSLIVITPGGYDQVFIDINPPQPRQVTVTADPIEGGMVTGGGQYLPGETVTVIAEPNPGYAFSFWSDGSRHLISDQSVFTFEMGTSNRQLIAHFETVPAETLEQVSKPTWSGDVIHWNDVANATSYQVSLQKGNQGVETRTVQPGIEQYDFTTIISEYGYGSYTVTVQAQGDGVVYLNGPISLPSDANVKEEPTYSLTLQATPLGGGTVIDNTDAGTYTAGSQVSVSAHPNEGYEFVSWTVGEDVESEEPNFTYEMPAANTTLVANFQEETNTIVSATVDPPSIEWSINGQGEKMATTITWNNANEVASVSYSVNGSTPIALPNEYYIVTDANQFIVEDWYFGEIGPALSVDNVVQFAISFDVGEDSIFTVSVVDSPPSLFAGGSGTEGDPYLISTPQHLDNVREFLGSTHYFKLANSIILDSSSSWSPIGSQSSKFLGVFDGNGRTISNLWINQPDDVDIGLFGAIGGNAVIANLNLEVHSSGINGFENVGALVGTQEGTTPLILNCRVSGGPVSSSYGKNVGGLVGQVANGVVQGSQASVNVFSWETAGGLIGLLDGGIISESSATGSVLVDFTWGYGQNAGGLIGSVSAGQITSSYATGNVLATHTAGGLVGSNYGQIISSYATGDIGNSAQRVYPEYAGGLVGSNQGSIVFSYSEGRVAGSFRVGGLVGENYGGLVSNSFSLSSVEAQGIAGGLVGRSNDSTTIEDSYALNPEVVRRSGSNSDFGRVVANGLGTLIGNYANVHMGGYTEAFTERHLTSKDGADLAAWNIVDGAVYPVFLTLDSEPLPNGTQDAAYSYPFVATGGIEPYTFAIDGSLPAGISLVSGTLSGVPTESGLHEFTVTVTDAINQSTSHDYQLLILSTSGGPELLYAETFLDGPYSTRVRLVFDQDLQPFDDATAGAFLNGVSASGFYPWYVTVEQNQIILGQEGQLSCGYSATDLSIEAGLVQGIESLALNSRISGRAIEDGIPPRLESARATATDTIEFFFGEQIQFPADSGTFLTMISASGMDVQGASANIVDGDTVLVTLDQGNEVPGDYYATDLVIEDGAVYDAIGNKYVYQEYYDDEIDNAIAPLLVGLTPATGATGVVPGSDLVLEFDKDVEINEGTYILIRRADDHKIVQTIAVQYTWNWGYGTNVITIPGAYTEDLDFNTAYYVTIDPGVFSHYYYSDTHFAGILDDTTWRFTTLNPVFAGGTGSDTDPYLITTQEHLNDVRYLRDKSMHFRLESDITLQGNWDPIGDYGKPFNGLFDGNGKIVSNLTIDQVTSDNIGFFGVTSSQATIQNVTISVESISGVDNVGGLVGYNRGTIIGSSVQGGTINGEYYVGGLVGESYYGNISGCSSSSNVRGNYDVGGLVGENNRTPIVGSYATGDVIGADYVGGLVGENYEGNIEDCYATGSVVGLDDVGGLVGEGDGSIVRSYATGNVRGEDYVGGLVGDSDGGTIQSSYTTGVVSGSYSVGGLVGDASSTIESSYALNERIESLSETSSYFGRITGYSSYATLRDNYANKDMVGPVDFTFKTPDGKDGGDLVSWTIVEGVVHPVTEDRLVITNADPVQGAKDVPVSVVIALTFSTDIAVNQQTVDGVTVSKQVAEGSSESIAFQANVNGNVLEIIPSGTLDTATVYSVLLKKEGVTSQDGSLLLNQDYAFTFKTAYFVDGDGSADNPFLIRTAQQLSNLRNYLGRDYIATNFKLANDISLSGFEAESGWLPISYGYDEFYATLDGAGHTISDLRMARTGSSYLGLFETIGETGIVKDISLVIDSISGGGSIGGLAFHNDGLISGCTVTLNNTDGGVSGTGNVVGGLVGRNDGVITSSSVVGVGAVSGQDSIGGLVGENYGEISSSDSVVNVSGRWDVGGLVGENWRGIITSSSAEGKSQGDSRVGGLIGTSYAASIIDSHASGNVTAQSDAGGLIGNSSAWDYNDTGTIFSSSASGTVYGNTYIGGLVGYNWAIHIVDSYALNDRVTGQRYVGGLVGYNDESFASGTYATAFVEGDRDVGGLVGYSYSGVIEDSYGLNPKLARISGEDEGFGRIVGRFYSTVLRQNYANKAMIGPIGFTERTPDGKDGQDLLNWTIQDGKVEPEPLVGTKEIMQLDGVVFSFRLAPAATFPYQTGTDTVNSDFWIAETETTYELWHTVYSWATDQSRGPDVYTFANAGQEGSHGTTGESPTSAKKNEPVTMISWRDSIVWLNALTEYYNQANNETLQPVYTYDDQIIRDATNDTATDNAVATSGADGFRLPSEKEWELAARYIGSAVPVAEPLSSDALYISNTYWTPSNYASGATGPAWVDGDIGDQTASSAVAWYSENSSGITHQVGQKPVVGTLLGLFDMSGNVWEWCFDSDGGSDRVERGGSWFESAERLQVTYRGSALVSSIDIARGFRITRSGISPVSGQAVFIPTTNASLAGLEKIANKDKAEIGDIITYTITLDNSTQDENEPSDLFNVVVQDKLPMGLSYLPGSFHVVGESGDVVERVADPVLKDGVLFFKLADDTEPIGANSKSFTYQAVVTPFAQAGKEYVNRAVAFHDQDGSGTWENGESQVTNVAEARVQVVRGVFSPGGTIVGKVFHDRNRSGTQDPGEPGLEDVRILASSGAVITTDQFGAYSLPGLSPRIVTLKLDQWSLLPGYVIREELNVVDVSHGGLLIINFPVWCLEDEYN